MFRTILIGICLLQAVGARAGDNSIFAARRDALMKKIKSNGAAPKGLHRLASVSTQESESTFRNTHQPEAER